MDGIYRGFLGCCADGGHFAPLRQADTEIHGKAVGGGGADRAAWGDNKSRLPSPQYLMVALVITLGIFLMILPQNLLSTISSPQFVTYMGIGEGEIRLDIRQTEDIASKTEQVEKLLAEEEQVGRFAVLRTLSCRAVLPDGSDAALQVEQGDHTIFPVAYTKGAAPNGENEIALSRLCAEELGFDLGDTLLLLVGETPAGIHGLRHLSGHHKRRKDGEGHIPSRRRTSDVERVLCFAEGGRPKGAMVIRVYPSPV